MRRVILQNFREFPHGVVAKKNVARPNDSQRFAREMAESTECSTCERGSGESRQDGKRRRFLSAPWRATRRFVGRGRLDDSVANRRSRNHCLHASHWIVIFTRVERRTCILRANDVREHSRRAPRNKRETIGARACASRQPIGVYICVYVTVMHTYIHIRIYVAFLIAGSAVTDLGSVVTKYVRACARFPAS